MKKNEANQKWRVFAFNVTTGLPVTGDASNITAMLSKDHGALVATNDVNPAEQSQGYYLFNLTQAETNCDWASITPISSTANVKVIGDPPSQQVLDLALLYQRVALITASSTITPNSNASLGVVEYYNNEGSVIKTLVTGDHTSYSIKIHIETPNKEDVAAIDDGVITKTATTLSFTLPSAVLNTIGTYKGTIRKTTGQWLGDFTIKGIYKPYLA